MKAPHEPFGERVLLLVPGERDSALAARVLADAGLDARPCADLADLVAQTARGAGAIVLAEELLADPQRTLLKTALGAQPAWSDLPVLLLSPFGAHDPAHERWALRELGNVTVLERPLRIAALLTAAKSALRARARQYELRDRIRMSREAEMRERQRAEVLESLLRAVPAAIFIGHDPACRDITGNPAAVQWLRLRGDNASASAPGAAARGFVEHRDGEPVPPAQLPMQRAVASGAPVAGDELELRFADGTSRHLFGNAVPLMGDDGRPRGAVAAFVDVTELKTAETSVRRQAQRLRLLSEGAAVVLETEDADAMAQLLFHRIGPHVGLDGYFSFEVAPGTRRLRLKSWFGVAEEKAREVESLDFGVAVCGRVAAAGRMMVVDDVQRSADPAAEWIRGAGFTAYVSFPLVANGEVTGTLSFGSRSKPRFEEEEIDFLATLCRYVTLASERTRLIGRLREADRRKDQFLATLAHELRNPLAPMRNTLEILRLTSGPSAAVEHARAVMDRQLRQLARIVDDLLDMSRITSGKLALRAERVDLSEVLASAVELARPIIEEGGHVLTLATPPAPCVLHGDPVRLAQVFANLLGNAAKYMDRGGRIQVAVDCAGSEVAVKVRDEGIGIPPEMLPRLFDPFAQLDRSVHRAQGGLGMGLALVRELTALHGGRVEAHSEGEGRGAEFIVRLPLPAPQETASPAPQEARAAAAPARLRILVADDNADSADTMSALLQMLGHEVHTVGDGDAALAAAEAFAPDVALLDIGMPGRDGYEVAAGIRAAPWSAGMTLAALTGWGQDTDRRRAREAGFDHHFTKPLDFAALEGLLANVRPRGRVREAVGR